MLDKKKMMRMRDDDVSVCLCVFCVFCAVCGDRCENKEPHFEWINRIVIERRLLLMKAFSNETH